jgi:fructose-bisphosphate aldolase class II
MVLFNFKEEISADRREEILQLSRKKLAALPGVSHLLVGKTIKADDEFAYALSMYFENEDALNTYRDHPDHVHFRDVDLFPHLDGVRGLDYTDNAR